MYPGIFGLLGLVFSILLLAPKPVSLAQTCVAQGDGSRGGWGPCGRSSSAGRTITIIVEQAPQIILGPPQIRWVLPSAEGSRQATFSSVDNAALRAALNDISTSGYQIYLKGRNAEREGNPALAREYYEAAKKRNNSPAEMADIEAAHQRVSRLFDGPGSGLAIDKFEKTQNTMKVEVDGVHSEIFNPKRTDMESYRKELMPLLLQRSDARAAIEKADLQMKAARINPSLTEKATADLKKAEAELEKTETAVKEKVEEVKKTFKLVEE